MVPGNRVGYLRVSKKETRKEQVSDFLALTTHQVRESSHNLFSSEQMKVQVERQV